MKALLALENGFTLEGRSFTGSFETGGEVIFNTGMTGYQEVLTDPSYYGQLVCLTYPLIGNYGITAEDMESAGIHMRALLVKECCKEPSNWRSIMSLPEFMKKHNVPGMEGIDTRALTIALRENGAMRCMISTEDLDRDSLVAKARALPTMEGQSLVQYVCPKTPYIWHKNAPKPVTAQANGRLPFVGGENNNGNRPIRLLVYDFGISDTMEENPSYTKWWKEWYLPHFPRPYRDEHQWNQEDVGKYHFRICFQDRITLKHPFSLDDFVEFMLIQSNVNARIEKEGLKPEEVREAFMRSLDRVFGKEKRVLIFQGYSWCFQKVTP